MTRLAKVLVVLVAAASLGFVAFAGAMRSGGPNWQALANSPAITEKVSIVRSETGAYTATDRVTGQQVATSPNNLASVVLKSQDHVLKGMQDELTTLTTEIATLTPQKATVQALIAVDEAGLQKHAAVWMDQLQTLANRITQMTDELASTGTTVQQAQTQLRELRYEVMRLKNQLELLRNDRFAAGVQQKALESELLLLQENRLRLERRQDQLKSQLGKYEEAPPAAAQTVPEQPAAAAE